MLSAQTETKKRSRGETEDSETTQDMELDQAESMNLIENVASDVLRVARQYACEILEKSLFMEIEIPLSPVESQRSSPVDFSCLSNPFLEIQTQPNAQSLFNFTVNRQGSEIVMECGDPSIQHYCNAILKQQNCQPLLFSQSRPRTPRHDLIMDHIINRTPVALEPQDTPIMASLLMNHLQSLPRLIPKSLHSVCQGILALNQASSNARKLTGATVKTPSPHVRHLVSNVLTLLPTDELRHLRQLIAFCSQMCGQTEPKNRTKWARQLALIMGPKVFLHDILPHQTPRRGYDKTEFAATFFELLMHCHGLHFEAHSTSIREIWCISETNIKRILRELMPLRTPSKRAKSVNSTPRKNTRSPLVRSVGQASKRSLFRKIEPKRANYVPTNDGKTMQDAQCDTLDREKYSKRLKLE